MDIAIVLSLLVIAIVLFATERISVDVITFLMLIVLILRGILTPAEAFEGFSSDIIIILGSVFVISGALQETGVLDAVGARLSRLATGSEVKLMLALMASTAAVSAFMNNTTVTAMLLGPVIGIARRSKIAASKLLMPLAFGSILGGTCTLIGTSTNVAVSGYMKRAGLHELGMFEITPLGIILCVIGMAYMALVGRRLLPDRVAEDLTQTYGIRHYLSEIVILPDSPLIGQRSYESDLSILDFRILKVIRGIQELLPSSRVILEKGDTLLVEGKVEDLLKVKKIEGIEIKSEMDLGDLELQSSEFRVAELLITPQSELAGATLKSANFRARYGFTALALNRHGQTVAEKLGDVQLRVGDVLLVQGPESRFETLAAGAAGGGLAMLERVAPTLYHPRKGIVTVALFVLAILAGSIGIMPLSVAFLASAVLAVLLGCITVERAYNFVDWRLLVLIGGMTAFGTAMDKTQAAHFLAEHIVFWLAGFGPMTVLAGFFLLTIVLTQPMSNAAAALVVLPVALEAAEKLGVSGRTFAIGVMLAASVSFVTPFEPSCILVYGPGKYRFSDFLKVGTGMTLVLAVPVLLLLPLFWKLH